MYNIYFIRSVSFEDLAVDKGVFVVDFLTPCRLFIHQWIRASLCLSVYLYANHIGLYF